MVQQSYTHVVRRRCQFQQFGTLTNGTAISNKDESQSSTSDVMMAWYLLEYGSLDRLHLVDNIEVPKKLGKHELLVKVNAASINQLDVEMCKGYGRAMINSVKKMSNVKEFPLILGRDCSGVVVKKGKMVNRLKEGDEVWCTKWPTAGQGTHAEYVVVSQNETALKPAGLSHVQAACFPFVASTVWPALVTRGGLNDNTGKDKRVLILGGSGGIGTFAIQLAKLFGAEVTATCSTENSGLCITLGADVVLDYKSDTFNDAMKNLDPFDVILDARASNQQNRDIFRRHSQTVYVSLMPPLLPTTDKVGIIPGLFSTSADLILANAKLMLCGSGMNTWGLFFPNSGILDAVKKMIDKKKIVPVLGKVFKFNETREAYQLVETGHTKGKVIIEI